MYKKITIALIAVLIIKLAVAQEIKNNFYVKTMQEELDRSMKKLQLPDLKKPFFISFHLQNVNEYTIKAERGIIENKWSNTPQNQKVFYVKLRVGDYHRNFDYMMNNTGGALVSAEEDADEFKRNMWLATDWVYKNVTQEYSNNLARLKNINVDEKELALDDISQITPVVKDFGGLQPIVFDEKLWEDKLKKLSALFTADKTLTNTGCQLQVRTEENYTVTSEGTVVRQPKSYAIFKAFAYSQNDSTGQQYSSTERVVRINVAELPAMDSLTGIVKSIMNEIAQDKKAQKFEGSYFGPVLFENYIAMNQLVSIYYDCNQFSPTRKSLFYNNGGTNYEDKIGQKLVSPHLNIVALPKLKKYDGVALTGYFDADGDGVLPPDSLTLIENGKLKTLMSNRTPTHKFKTSQGFKGSSAYYGGINPGVLKIYSQNTLPNHLLKGRLIKLAKEEGLNCAYIYRPTGIYKIDVATQKETLMKDLSLKSIGTKGFRRFDVASSKLQVHNFEDYSYLTPESIIINEVEIEKEEQTVKPKPTVVTNPLLK